MRSTSIAATTNKKDVTPIEQKIKYFSIKGKKGKASSRSYEVSVPAGSVGDYNVSISLDIDWKELGKETWKWIKSASRTMFSDHSGCGISSARCMVATGAKWHAC